MLEDTNSLEGAQVIFFGHVVYGDGINPSPTNIVKIAD